MIREGKGLIAPPKVTVRITRYDLDHYKVIARQRDERRGYAQRKDAWGKGFVDNPTLMGLVGEHCYAEHLSRKLGIPVRVNIEDAPQGDGGVDLEVLGTRIQVKTRKKGGDTLIRRVTEDGRIVQITWHIIATATYDPATDPYACDLDGFVNWQEFLDDAWYKKGRVGDWMNLELQDKHLRPAKEMVEAFKLMLPGGCR